MLHWYFNVTNILRQKWQLKWDEGASEPNSRFIGLFVMRFPLSDRALFISTCQMTSLVRKGCVKELHII